MNRRLIGLTGGIATGKSTVSNYLAQTHNLLILDADVYAREAVAPDSLILQKIFDRYGNKVKSEDGSLNRSALGEIIFDDITEKHWLERQVHPYVRERFQQELQRTNDDTVVLDIPLLFEANLMDTVTEIWVVICDRLKQIARLQQRNSLSKTQAEARIDSQIPLSQKVAAADVILDNNQNLQYLFTQIDVALKLSN
ncbi:MAG: dephospho-CoA kinase [Cyanobacteria bacterium P01_G01_bin.19]